MKRLIFTALCLMGMGTGASAQKPEKDMTYTFGGEPYKYSGVINTDSTEKASALYAKAIKWFALTFKDSKSVLQMQDKDNGIIIGKASFSWPCISLYGLNETQYGSFTVKIQVKDGKYKYEMFDFSSPGYGLVTNGGIVKYPDIKIPFGGTKKFHKMADNNFANLKSAVVNNGEIAEESLKLNMSKKLGDDF